MTPEIPAPLLHEASVDDLIAELTRRAYVVVIGIETPEKSRFVLAGPHTASLGAVAVLSRLALRIERRLMKRNR